MTLLRATLLSTAADLLLLEPAVGRPLAALQLPRIAQLPPAELAI
jgi:hypothetical protein